MSQDMTYYEANPAEFLELSQEDQATIFNGGTIEGETTSESPDADAAEEVTDEASPDEEEAAQEEATPVPLAKDGQNTIPYAELQTALDLAKQYEQLVRDQAAIIESLKATPTQQPDPETDTLAELKDEYAQANLLDEPERAQEVWNKIQSIIEGQAAERARSLVSQEFERRDAEARAVSAQEALDSTVASVIAAYPFLDSTKQTANAEAIADVVRWRNALVYEGMPMHEALAQAAAKFAPMYAPKPAQSIQDAGKAAAAAIANARARPITSLSSIPSSATPPHDEMQALSGLSVIAMQEKMMGMSPEKIMSLINKTVIA